MAHAAGHDSDRREEAPGFLRRNRGWVLTATYFAVAALLGVLGVSGQRTGPLDLLIMMGEPLASILADDFGPWTAVVAGVALNGSAIGYAVTALDRFGGRMDRMTDLAVNVLNRGKE
jgi:hypothetical protein